MPSRVRPLLFLMFAFSLSFAQALSKIVPAKPDLSQYDAVTEKMVDTLAFESDGSSTLHQMRRIKIQSEAGVQNYGLILVSFSTATSEVTFDYVRITKPDGAVINASFDDLQEVPAEVTQQAPMYSDIRVKHLPVPNLRPGDILEFSFAIHNAKPLIPNQFWFEYKFSKQVILLDYSLALSWPSAKPVLIHASDKFTPEIAEANGRKTYSFHYQNLSIPDDAEKKKDKNAKPHPAPDPDQENKPDIQLTTFQSWKNLATTIDAMFSDRAKSTGEIDAKVASLIKGKTTDEEKISAIYRFVAQEYRYISISLGIGRLQPHSAETVFSNHFGDCKDKHTLLAAMLTSAGYKPHALLIGSARKLDPDIPSPAQFDHVITAVETPNATDKDHLLILDSTPELARAGYLFPMLRAKKALLVGGPRNGDIIETSANPLNPMHRRLAVDAKINDLGKITAKIAFTFRDDSEPFLRQLYNATSRNNWNQLTQQISYSLGYAGEVENAMIADPLLLDQPFQISYDYSREDYITWSGTGGSVHLPLIPIMDTTYDASEMPTKPIPLDGPIDVQFTATVTFPNGATATPLAPVDTVRSFGEYHARYALKQNILTISRSLKLHLRELPLHDLESFRAFTRTVADDQNAELQVTRLNDKSLDAPASSSAEELASATEAALHRHHFKTAQSTAQQLVTLKPDTTIGWSLLGTAEAAQFDLADAVKHFRKQLEVNPQHESAGIQLGVALNAMGDASAAIAALQSFLKDNPENPAAKAALANVFLDAKRYEDAIPLFTSVLESAPDNSALKFLLAQSYMGLNDHRADPLIQQMAGDPGAKNNIAYKMAELNYDLPTAQKLAEESIAALAAKNLAAKLPADSTAMLRNTSLQSAAWDTLGYILYLRGDYPKAIDYLSSAWSLSPDQTVGQHLADAYHKAADLKAEQHIRYLLPGAERAPQTVQEAYQKHLHSAPQFAFTDAKIIHELQEMRTIHPHLRKPAYQSSAVSLTSSSTAHTDDVFTEGSSSTDAHEEYRLIKAAPFPGKFPAGLKTKILRTGYLSCNPGSDCIIVLMPLATAATVPMPAQKESTASGKPADANPPGLAATAPGETPAEQNAPASKPSASRRD